ncbi:glycosyltransferase [Algivirga pacifica]|uniref:Glycosyltransferase family 4 protein n=1 Tax=Algivirga pacifica TaxID=1162670 RepID=A0ABP9DDG1_9BACT
MRIAFLSVFYPFRGGIAQSNAQLYRAFEEEGHEVKAWNFTTQYPSILFPGTSQYVTEEDTTGAIVSERVLSTVNPLTFAGTIRKIAAYEPDMVILRYWMPFFAPSLGYVAGKLRKKGIKVITVIDNLIPHEQRPGDKQLTDYFLNRCDGFVVMSDVVEKDLKSVKPDAAYLHHPHPIYDHFGEKQEKALARKTLGLKSEDKVLLYFGLIRKYKGLDLLIEAFDQLDDSYQLLIVGEPYEDFEPYQQLIDNNANKERIHTVTRYVADEEVPLYFSAADVSVLPYRTATQSGVVAISYHFDLPVIVTNVGGLKGTVAPYGSGIVVEESTPHAITTAVQDYFKGENPKEMSLAVQNFKEKYSWKGMVRAILKRF